MAISLYNVRGELVKKNVSRYAARWDAKCRSEVQFKVKQFLKPYWQHYMCFEEFPVFGTLLKVDLVNLSLKIAVEVNGNQHYKYNKHFHQGQPANWLYSLKRDVLKEKWLELNGFKFIEIYEQEAHNLSKEYFKKQFDLTL